MKHTLEACGFRIAHHIAVGLLLTLSLLVAACSGSDESSRDDSRPAVDTAAMRKTVETLRSENQSLKSQLEKARQDNRALTAHAAELETQLNEFQGKDTGSQDGMPMKVNVVKGTSGLPSAEGNPLYERGLSFFMARKYDDAIGAFREFLSSGVPSTLEDNSHYWIGECFYAKKNFRAAIEEFAIVAGVQGTDKADDALIMLGQSHLSLGNKNMARQYFERLIRDYPASPFLTTAKTRLGGL
jgi:tol-pal system protein YbgF